MAVNRQFNALGQERIEVPHLRLIESSICYDFDAVGLLIVGETPCVIRGFDILNPGSVVGSLATSLSIRTASARLVHPLASDSGSFFQVPASRPDEVLNSINGKIQGAWTPNTTNYVGVDLIRNTDETTVDTATFLNSVPDTESNLRVPLGRTLDYIFTISNQPFSVSPTICPLYLVVTNSNNTITSITDARNLLFSNGNGGDSPVVSSPFGWPGGRTQLSPLVAGDRSIQSLKQWMGAVMTRFQEVGGGEYWYSLTADRNVKMIQSGVFTSNGEAFEWDGTHLHWKGIRFVFDNSTSRLNEVADQTTDSTGITNLADGECLYVDIDRSVARTVSGSNPLYAQKGSLSTLGGSSIPGQRWVMAWRVGNQIYIKDQAYPVGSSFVLATVNNVGTIRTTINANGDLTDPVAVGLGDSSGAYYTATCGGLSHNTDLGVSTLIGSGNLIIGRGGAAGDGKIFIQANTETNNIKLYAKTNYSLQPEPAVKIIQANQSSTKNRVAEFAIGSSSALPSSGTDTSITVTSINNDGSIGYSLAGEVSVPTPLTPSSDRVACKTFFRSSKYYTGQIHALFGLNGIGIPIDGFVEGPTGTFTAPENGALTSDHFFGVTPTNGMRVLAWNPGNSPTLRSALYTITSIGSGSTKAVLQKDTTPLFRGVTVYNSTAVGEYEHTILTLDTMDPIVFGTTKLHWSVTTSETRDQYCVMWTDGSTTVLAESPPREMSI